MLSERLAWMTIGAFMVVSCASVDPTYRSYVAKLPDECYVNGSLLGKIGPDGWPDISMKVCQPDDSNKAKCYVQTEMDYFAKDQELLTCRQKLKDCESGPPPKI